MLFDSLGQDFPGIAMGQKAKFACVDYSGPDAKLTAADVLQCLQLDCQAAEQTLDDFMSECGYEGLGGVRVWEACNVTRRDILAVVGRDNYRQFLAYDFNEEA